MKRCFTKWYNFIITFEKTLSTDSSKKIMYFRENMCTEYTYIKWEKGIEMSETGNKKKYAAAAAVIAALAVIFGVIYLCFAPKAAEGSKRLTIEVVDDAGQSEVFTVHTDAEYLREALEETQGLTVEGTESDYGLMVETVNGVTADYNVNGAYWAFYVNGAYADYGVDKQPVMDGETYSIVYTTAE